MELIYQILKSPKELSYLEKRKDLTFNQKLEEVIWDPDCLDELKKESNYPMIIARVTNSTYDNGAVIPSDTYELDKLKLQNILDKIYLHKLNENDSNDILKKYLQSRSEFRLHHLGSTNDIEHGDDSYTEYDLFWFKFY